MKKLTVATIMILAVAAANARAQLVTMEEVLPDANGNFEAHRLAAGLNAIPAGFRSWQIIATTTPGAKWVGAEVDLILTEGSLHYNAILGGNLGTHSGAVDVKTGKLSPSAALYSAGALFEALPFTTHFSAPGIDGIGQRKSPVFTPEPVRPGGQNTKFTLDEIIASYVEFDPLLGAAGTHVIGMITLSDDAAGTILVRMTDEETVAVTAPGPNPGDPPVVIVPANPAIFDGVIEGGEIGVPEPSTALLAMLGLIGMIAGFTRRRNRQA